MIKLPLLCATGAILLSACGGSGNSIVTFPELIERVDALDSLTSLNIDDENLSITPDELLQDSGSASFTGVAFAAVEPANDQDAIALFAIGSTTVDVNFGTGTIEGQSDNFYSVDDPENADFESFDDLTGTAIDGAVDFSLAQTVAGENFFEGETSGTLTAPDGTDYRFGFPAAGGFLGDESELFALESFDVDADADDTSIGFGVFASRD